MLVFLFGSKPTRDNSAESTEAEDEEVTTTYIEPHEKELEGENFLASALEVMDSTVLSDGDVDKNLGRFM
jgi:hypothetical protein